MHNWFRPILISGIALIAIAAIARPTLGQQFSLPQAGELDRRMINLVDKTSLTEETYRGVVRGLNLLPPEVKKHFLDCGVSVLITPTLEQVGDHGQRSEYSPKTHTVIICEYNQDNTPSDQKRMHITVLHELGHAFDQLLGYPSRQAEFHQIYEREAPTVPPQYQQVLSYFLQPGQPGARECFASLFACKYYQGDDKRLTALKASFPQTFRYVDGLHF